MLKQTGLTNILRQNSRSDVLNPMMYVFVLFLRRRFNLEGNEASVAILLALAACYMLACLGVWSWAHIFSIYKKYEDVPRVLVSIIQTFKMLAALRT